MKDLFSAPREEMAPGAWLLRDYALESQDQLLSAIDDVTRTAPFRHMVTPGGYRMSVAMSNCGPLGWVTDSRGYRYSPIDPDSGKAWPAMPEAFRLLACQAAEAAGYQGFQPDACLINRYEPGTKLSLHQDKDEHDFGNPIVSVSLGLTAQFQFGGLQRSDPIRKYALHHGDVVVWGGPSRLFYHGILTLKSGPHPQMGDVRINLTFRRAG